jgi:hypothetical protein
MDRRRKTIIGIAGGALVVAVAGGGAGIAAASGGGDSDTPITGAAVAKASSAALAYTGGGTVTGTEVHDEDGYYEVEVTAADGGSVDVHLDQNFTVTGSTADHDTGADSDTGGGSDAHG